MTKIEQAHTINLFDKNVKIRFVHNEKTKEHVEEMEGSGGAILSGITTLINMFLDESGMPLDLFLKNVKDAILGLREFKAKKKEEMADLKRSIQEDIKSLAKVTGMTPHEVLGLMKRAGLDVELFEDDAELDLTVNGKREEVS